MSKKFTDPIDGFFEFPESLLKQISECTNGNYIIFYSNNGEPDVRAEFSDTINEIGIRAYATNFIGGINAAEEISSTQDFLGMNGGHDPDCDRFEDEDED
jgi:hypothetical protein